MFRIIILLALLAFPFLVKGFLINIGAQVFLAMIGALALMLLTGFAGQVSLGTAGLLCAGAFTTAILYKELNAPMWVTLPASALTGAILGFIFGLPSLRLRRLYLAVSTLALHFIVIYAGSEYENHRALSSGISIPTPRYMNDVFWYFTLFFFAAVTWFLCNNLLKSKTGRAFQAFHSNETVAAALGINVARMKLTVFMISSSLIAFSGSLFAYMQGAVGADAFSIYLTIQYVAMIIIGGMGTLNGALYGAVFVTLLPYGLEYLMSLLPNTGKYASAILSINAAAFGLVMILFLMFEPGGINALIKKWVKK